MSVPYSLTRRLLAALLCIAVAGGNTLADDAEVLTGMVRAHDPSSIVEREGRYYLFSTGRGLSIKSSADLVEWQMEGRVFGRNEIPAWIAEHVPGFRGHYWAPDLIEIDGRYLLYYSASRFGKQTSTIGLTVNETLDPNSEQYAWQDAGVVISSVEGDPYNAIDPSILSDNDGRLWMAFGSYWKGIYLVELDRTTGGRLQTGSEPVRLAHASSIEAATLIRRDEYYYLFVNHGTCCRGIESTYRILVGRSRTIEGPYLDREGKRLLDGGGTLVLNSAGRRIGPGHVAPLGTDADRFGFHFYDGDDRGRSKLALASWNWSEDGWPAATDIQLPLPVKGTTRPSYKNRDAAASNIGP